MRNNFTFLERFALLAFLILTPLLSLAIPIFFALPAEMVPLLMVLVPAVMAVFLTAISEGGKGVKALLNKLVMRVSLKWIFIAPGLALLLRLSISLLAILIGWIPTMQLYPWSSQQFLIIGVFTLLGATMEELGWRGYALPRLMVYRSPLASALIIGIPWGILHLGLTLKGQMNFGMPWMATILFLVALSVVLTWLFVETRGSLFIVILHHAVQNFLVFLNGGVPFAESSWLLAAVTAVLALVIVFSFGPSLQRNPRSLSPVGELTP
jgi:membrane protease YdiL (CAAX protease family)